MTIAYISIGSNLASPRVQANNAITALKRLPKSYVLSVSSYYRTEPLGLLNQPEYLNAVVALKTDLNAHILLENIQRIELQQGRQRKDKFRWESRIIDLDLMLFGNEIINTANLTVPHYDMHNRGFMLWPLIEIAPQLHFPNGETLKSAVFRLGVRKPSPWQ